MLGGDHSLSMGSVNGVARRCADIGRELFVLWLDAHADFNTPETSPSGNMHGMSLAMLAGEPGLETCSPDHPRAPIKPANIYLFGVRSLDRDERNLLGREASTSTTCAASTNSASRICFEQILDEVRRRDGLLHVSLDVDFLDPSIAPAVGTAVPGGATYREAHLIMEMLCDCGTRRLARSGRAEPHSRRARQKRSCAGRTRRQPVRPQDHRPRAREPSSLIPRSERCSRVPAGHDDAGGSI